MTDTDRDPRDPLRRYIDDGGRLEGSFKTPADRRNDKSLRASYSNHLLGRHCHITNERSWHG